MRRGTILPVRRRRDGPDTAIAIVNLVLLLILFFLVSGGLWNRDAPTGLRLAETRAFDPARLPRPLLELTPDGRLALDGQAVALAGLPEALAGASRVHLLIDRSAPARQLLHLLGSAGFDGREVVLVTVRAGGGGTGRGAGQ